MEDLYKLNLVGDARKMCGGNDDTDGSEESCVTLMEIEGAPGAVALGDSKKPGAEPFRFTADEMRALVTTYAKENAITL